MEVESVEIIEAVPGRLRLLVPGLGRDPDRAEQLRRTLAAYPGVVSVHVGLLSNHLTFDFDPAEAQSVLLNLEHHFPEAHLSELDLERELALREPEPTAERPMRPDREQAYRRAATKRKGIAAAGAAVAGLFAGLVLRKLLHRK